MKFTVKGKKVDAQVKAQLDTVCDEISKNIPVESIILYGGFGRGEGTVKVVGEEVTPVNDYDIYVITKNKVPDDVLDNLAKQAAKKLGKKGIDFHSFDKKQTLEENFYIDLKCLTLKQLQTLLPMVRYYELKNASTVVYGKDARDLIPDYSVDDIPLSEGARLLLNRMTHLVEYLSLEGGHDAKVLMLVIAKAYLDSCTALLLLSRKYVPTYDGRMKIFSDTYKRDFPELYKILPELEKRVKEFTEWKLYFNDFPDKDIKKVWLEARNDIWEVSKYFFSRFLQKDIKTCQDFSSAISGMKKVYYRPYVYYFLKARGIKSGAISTLATYLLPFYFKYLYFIRVKKYKRTYWRVLLNTGAPDLLIFSALPYILLSVNENSVDDKLLREGIEKFKKVYPISGTGWDAISQDYANAYVLFFLQKIV